MKFIDMHCDTLMPFAQGGDYNIYQNDKSVDFLKMKKGGQLAQFFAMFILPDAAWARYGREPMSHLEYIDCLQKGFYRDLEAHKDMIAYAGNYEDLKNNEAAGKMSAFLTIEDGVPVDGKLENLQKFYDMGVRLISLTWNFPNCFGYPNSKDPEIMSKGLTSFGCEAVERMNELGIIVDVSHLSDGGFMDVARISKKPFVASHSNCRALSPHQRNMTDEMIRIMGEKGGVSGINFGPEFLNEDLTIKDSTVVLMSKHMQRMKNLGGIDMVALGSDFDGVSGNLEVADCSMMELLFDQMKKDGFTESEIEKVAYLNAERVIRESMK